MSDIGNFVWGIADQLRSVYKPAKYGDVILPMTILRRLDCILEGHRDTIAGIVATTDNDEIRAALISAAVTVQQSRRLFRPTLCTYDSMVK